MFDALETLRTLLLQDWVYFISLRQLANCENARMKCATSVFNSKPLLIANMTQHAYRKWLVTLTVGLVW